MALPDQKATIGDGSNGILMYDGEIVYAYNSVTRLKTVLGILRFSEGGTPYLGIEDKFDFAGFGLPESTD
jgi:hypothetical protein